MYGGKIIFNEYVFIQFLLKVSIVSENVMLIEPFLFVTQIQIILIKYSSNY